MFLSPGPEGTLTWTSLLQHPRSSKRAECVCLCRSGQGPGRSSRDDGASGFRPPLERAERPRQPEKRGITEERFYSPPQSHPCSSTQQNLNGLTGRVDSGTPYQTPPPLSEQGDQGYPELVKPEKAEEREEYSVARRSEGYGGEWDKVAARQGDGDRGGRTGEWQRHHTNETVREQTRVIRISYASKLCSQKDFRCDTTNGVEEAGGTACLAEEECVADSEMNEGLQESEREEHAHDELLPQAEEQRAKEHNEEEEEEEKREEERLKQMREEEREKKRRSVMERMKRLSLSGSETDEPFSPLSPTLMVEDAEGLTEEYLCSISERTESLNRSVKKSNSFQKTPPSVLISKIDSRLEQYNHAIEVSSQDARDAKAGLMDFPSSPEPVSAKKHLFEGGDAWSQNPGKAAGCKDTEGLKVGVADLITQWVKGSPDVGSKAPSAKPSVSTVYPDQIQSALSQSNEVKPGEVRQKKSLWETKETPTGEKPGGKANPGKKFKFVETGHGKYEKVLVDDSDSINHTNGKPSSGTRIRDAPVLRLGPFPPASLSATRADEL
ncbi:hypothetical protein NFI96_030018 [Prochilodus magdalenae]|nr:hypothetical protein NFI96_030018 [Prochilodus magdalenae]